MNFLNERIDELDSTNLLAICWAISILISKFNHNVADSMRKSVIISLPKQLENDKKGEVPTLCFSISSFLSQDPELEELIKNLITNYSTFYCKPFLKIVSQIGMKHISPLNLSLLMMAWTKVKLRDINCLQSAADCLIELRDIFTDENTEEVCKIFWSFYMLNYKEDIKLQKFLEDFIAQNLEKIDVNHAIDLFISFSSINSDNLSIYDMLIDIISQKYESSELRLDISSFVNLWLGISKLFLKAKENSLQNVTVMLNFLIHSYEIRSYLNASKMNPDELCSMIVSFSVLTLEPNQMYFDICDSIKKNLKNFNNIQLIQILSCGKYLFNDETHSGKI